MWVRVKIKPPGIGPQAVVQVSMYQGKPFWVHIFDPQACDLDKHHWKLTWFVGM